jgi:hypothetical protein
VVRALVALVDGPEWVLTHTTPTADGTPAQVPVAGRMF